MKWILYELGQLQSTQRLWVARFIESGDHVAPFT